METVKELRRLIEDLGDDLNGQHGKNTPYCEILHRELGIPETRKEDADTIIEKVRKKEIDPADLFGDDYESDSIRLTVEHEDLHEMLRREAVDAMTQGMGPDQIAAKMLSIGRRMGLREAAELMEG